MANKVYKDAKSALEGVLADGMMVMCGGFGLVGIPDKLIHAMRDAGVKNLVCVSNNAGIDGAGLGLLLENGQVKKMISSYVGENKTFAKLYLEGKLEIEFNPQGTLAERCRAGGADLQSDDGDGGEDLHRRGRGTGTGGPARSGPRPHARRVRAAHLLRRAVQQADRATHHSQGLIQETRGETPWPGPAIRWRRA